MRRWQKLNYIILTDGVKYYLFERMGKKVPFRAYNREKALVTANSSGEIFDVVNQFHSKSEIDFTQKLGMSSPKSWGSSVINFPENFSIGRWEIEENAIGVDFNE